MKRLLLIMFACGVVGSSIVYGEPRQIDLDMMSKEELMTLSDEISDKISEIDSQIRIEETQIAESDLIKFIYSDSFSDLRENLYNVKQAMIKLEIPVLIKSLEEYQNNYHDPVVDDLLSVLKEYGSIDGLVYAEDYFDGSQTVSYEGYNAIDENHSIYPYYNLGFHVDMGFIADDWLFADKAELKILDIESEDYFRAFSDSKRDVLDGGKIMEVVAHKPFDSEVDYLLNDMSGRTVIRFSGKNGDLDYELTENDKKALSSVAKFAKMEILVNDIFH